MGRAVSYLYLGYQLNYLSELQQAAECLRINDLLRAEQLYKQVLSCEPTNGHAYLGMGKIALLAEQYDKAVLLLTKSCELLPDEVSPLLHLAEAFNGVFSEQDGLTVLEYTAKSFSNKPLVYYRLGLQYLILGHLQKAESAFEKVLSLTNSEITSFAIFELTRLGHHSTETFKLLAVRLQQLGLTNDEKIVLHYAMGNVLDNQNDFNQAWSHFEQANLLQQQNCQFKTQQLVPFFKQIKVYASSQNLRMQRGILEQESANSVTPIFILGLPRTGSTLLEFLLTQHPDIASAGEVNYFSKDVDDFIFSKLGVRYPQSLSVSSDAIMQQAAALYLEKLALHANGKPYVIDKLPANFQSIGLIYKLFPHAKVLHIKRDLAAVALSIFRNNFAQNEPYFCSLNEFQEYHSLYADLMTHWKTLCANFIYEVSYEQLILDKTSTIKTLYKDLNISTTDKLACVKQQPAIKTLSNIQVNRPISTKSVEQWHNYRDFLTMFNDAKEATHAK